MIRFVKPDKKGTVALIAIAVSAVVVLTAAIAMIVSPRFMRLTIGADFVVRWLLIFVTGGSFFYGLVRMALCVLTGGDKAKTLSHVFLFCLLAELCAIVITVITFLGDADYQQNMNLIEDVLCIVFALIVGVLALFGYVFRHSGKRAFVVSVIAAAAALFLAFVDIAFVGPATVRAQDVDFAFVMSSLGAVFPYVATAVFCKCVPDAEEEPSDQGHNGGDAV
ncbi:MAG TPA: hypothetical protein H9892_00755 [Candidatus Protoclostridium stercorigallinarum]|uniref:Uncharacterized protein n=1 Tax=Candidatus Protoclostridium stercorigallinarum TaxID=2838741 RepID=A0A9D1PZ18_9FIRM|nr:hypothetical protein [Candidatus Protoclostridium stercorigallinarum]